MLGDNKISDSNVSEFKNSFFISINNTFEDLKPPLTNKENVKVLFFDDVLQDEEAYLFDLKKYQTVKAFNKEQAKELLQFIIENKDKKNCYIHCNAGISRSGAVGTFINDFVGGNYFEFMELNPQVKPNDLIIRLLKNEHNKF